MSFLHLFFILNKDFSSMTTLLAARRYFVLFITQFMSLLSYCDRNKTLSTLEWVVSNSRKIFLNRLYYFHNGSLLVLYFLLLLFFLVSKKPLFDQNCMRHKHVSK